MMIVICYHGIDNKCQGVCDWVVGTLCLSNKLCELCEFFDLQFNAMVENLVGNFDEIFVEKIRVTYRTGNKHNDMMTMCMTMMMYIILKRGLCHLLVAA